MTWKEQKEHLKKEVKLSVSGHLYFKDLTNMNHSQMNI